MLPSASLCHNLAHHSLQPAKRPRIVGPLGGVEACFGVTPGAVVLACPQVEGSQLGVKPGSDAVLHRRRGYAVRLLHELPGSLQLPQLLMAPPQADQGSRFQWFVPDLPGDRESLFLQPDRLAGLTLFYGDRAQVVERGVLPL